MNFNILRSTSADQNGVKYNQFILNSYTGDTYAYSKMSTQHIGDGPPKDDDPVGEESNRATGSGFNPNAAA